MSWKPPATDATHAMYQRGNKRGMSAYERAQTREALNHTPTPLKRDEVRANPDGSQAEKEAWMRQRQQRRRLAVIEGERERELLREIKPKGVL
jgi:hypothetical protein